MIFRFSAIVVLILFVSCSTVKAPFYDTEAFGWRRVIKEDDKAHVHSLYMVGDAGDLDDIEGGRNYVLEAIRKQLKEHDEEETLVFLGDNIYPNGLVPRNHEDRPKAEKILKAQLELAKDVQGTTVFIPGNHDWNKHKEGGLKYIKRQEYFVENYFEEDKPKVRMYPGHGCADPKVVKINKDLVFIYLDTQWWLQNWDHEPDINHGCEIKHKVDLLKSIEEIFTEHKNDEIVVLMHHPIMSNGSHGGKFSFRQHLFPLTDLNNKLWIPLPVIGSIYPMHRQVTGSVQDIPNVKNRDLMQNIDQIAKRLRVNVIFASGHEHSLQYFDQGLTKYVVSGSGSRTSYTLGGGGVMYAREARGFAKLIFYEDFETWLEFYSVAGFNEKPELEFRTLIREARAGTVDDHLDFPDVEVKDTIAAANESFRAGKFKSFFMGEQYRDLWAAPVRLPTINLHDNPLGHLTPIKKGGGMSSNSLRMETDNGKQYILRSINKDYTKLVPPQFTNLRILDVMKDQNSASHPYGALALPTLSKAAGIYYTDPKLIYLKHQESLHDYNNFFPEEFYLLEQRPSGDWSDTEHFGFSEEIIGYTDLLEILRTKKPHYIDQRWVCKSRMFDLLVHDWDRHDDQWRWASFEINKDSTVYRPIPRDRDQVFYKFKGLVPSLIAASVMRKFKGMKPKIRDVKYLAFNARFFDRYFMNELEWSEWVDVIEELKRSLPDEVFVEAFKKMPEGLPDKDSKEIISMLKSRRDNLLDTGEKLYKFISKEVEISGTDDRNTFEIDIGPKMVHVRYWVHRKDKGDLIKYDRTFYSTETKEIRIFGLDGKDEFHITGLPNSSIRIQIIGGEGRDLVKNDSGYKVIVHDDPDGMDIEKGKVRERLTTNLENNEYERNSFRYHSRLFTPTFGYTKDDGFWVGVSGQIIRHGWRKNPFKSHHSLRALVGPWSNEALRISYQGVFTDFISTLDFRPEFRFDYPKYDNFFGLGNESINPLREREYNWVRRRSIFVAPIFSLSTRNNQVRLDFGPTYESNKIIKQTGRISEDPSSGLSEQDFEQQSFAGARISNTLEFLDRVSKPTYGGKVHLEVSYNDQIDSDNSFWKYSVVGQSYLRVLNRPELVFANSIGFKKVDGTAPFYMLPSLGNFQNLRGFRHDRFRGNTAFFQNTDLRMQLFSSNNVILPFDMGLLAGFDIGRVWLNGEKSNIWHHGFTTGVWFDLLGMAVLQPYLSWSDEETLFSLKFGYNF